MTKKKKSVFVIALLLIIALLAVYVETIQPDEMLRNMMETVVLFFVILMWIGLNVLMFGKDKWLKKIGKFRFSDFFNMQLFF